VGPYVAHWTTKQTYHFFSPAPDILCHCGGAERRSRLRLGVRSDYSRSVRCRIIFALELGVTRTVGPSKGCVNESLFSDNNPGVDYAFRMPVNGDCLTLFAVDDLGPTSPLVCRSDVPGMRFAPRPSRASLSCDPFHSIARDGRGFRSATVTYLSLLLTSPLSLQGVRPCCSRSAPGFSYHSVSSGFHGSGYGVPELCMASSFGASCFPLFFFEPSVCIPCFFSLLVALSRVENIRVG